MILLIDLCYKKGSLSRSEFVDPIRDCVRRAGSLSKVLHFSEVKGDEIKGCEKVILCGTALKDNIYAKNIESFSWIRECKVPILGICAGMQVIGSSFGGAIVSQPKIGLEQIEITTETGLLGQSRMIEGYHLHNYGITLPEGFLIVAGTRSSIEAFKHQEKPIYGILFHPEVRNRWIIKRFVQL